MEQVGGIGPPSLDWQPNVIPLYDTCYSVVSRLLSFSRICSNTPSIPKLLINCLYVFLYIIQKLIPSIEKLYIFQIPSVAYKRNLVCTLLVADKCNSI